MGGRSVVEGLNGVPLQKPDQTSWEEFFVGTVAIENLEEDAEILRFDVIVPTSAHDVDDFIWTSERTSGSTDKAILMQAGNEVATARVVGIEREGPDPRWTHSPANQYRITFEVDNVALLVERPLELLLRWPNESGQWTQLARAMSSEAQR